MPLLPGQPHSPSRPLSLDIMEIGEKRLEIHSLLKRSVLLLTLLIVVFIAGAFSPVRAVEAQDTPTELEWLTIDLWPDFDRQAVLVLLTGSLPPEVTTPVEIAVPLLPGADVNAVARIDAGDSMLADLDPLIGEESVTFTLPDRRFRVEYYYPYAADGRQRTFTFEWLAPQLSVQDLSLAVQQPALAREMATDPAAEAITQGNDQLDYYNLPDEAVPAGESYEVDVTYTMSEDRLTAGTAENLSGAPEIAPALTDGGLDLDWPVVLGITGGLLIGVALAWQLFGDRLTGRATPGKPRPVRTQKQAASPRQGGTARFCHNCGEQVQPGDRFCRECGTRLKGT